MFISWVWVLYFSGLSEWIDTDTTASACVETSTSPALGQLSNQSSVKRSMAAIVTSQTAGIGKCRAGVCAVGRRQAHAATWLTSAAGRAWRHHLHLIGRRRRPTTRIQRQRVRFYFRRKKRFLVCDSRSAQLRVTGLRAIKQIDLIPILSAPENNGNQWITGRLSQCADTIANVAFVALESGIATFNLIFTLLWTDNFMW